MGEISPVGEVGMILRPSWDERVLFAATSYAYGRPGTGGIFKVNVGDTTWQYLGLMDTSLGVIEELNGFPGCLFVNTKSGEYLSEDGGVTWRPFPTVYDSHWAVGDFRISPWDANLWILSMHNSVSQGQIYISRNAGETWQLWYQGSLSNGFVFSYHCPEVFYYRGMMGFMCASLVDSTVGLVYDGPGLHRQNAIILHPRWPWVYVVTEDTLLRYNELTGEKLFRCMPDTSFWTTSGIGDGVGGLWIGAENGVYHVDEDLNQVMYLGTPFPQAWLKVRVLVDSTLVVRTWGGGSRDLIYGMTIPPGIVQGSVRPKIEPRQHTQFVQPMTRVPMPTEIEVYNILGQRIYAGPGPSGGAPVDWNMLNLASGLYIYRLKQLGTEGVPIQLGKVFITR
ncbi:MAG: hypothetical protein PHI18_10085 [bacterium]|nr:hypothetical protein [bacterium]